MIIRNVLLKKTRGRKACRRCGGTGKMFAVITLRPEVTTEPIKCEACIGSGFKLLKRVQ